MTITIPGCVSTGAPRRAPPGDASQQLSLVTAGCRATAGHRARLADYGSVSPVYCLLVTVPSCTTCLAPVPCTFPHQRRRRGGKSSQCSKWPGAGSINQGLVTTGDTKHSPGRPCCTLCHCHI